MPALSRERVEQIIDDLRYEPPWRYEAARESDLYDGNQLDQATLQTMKDLGMPPIVVNLIKPTIDAVIGLEARTRSDPLVRGENDASTDGAEALNVKMKEATRLSRFNRSTSDAFGGQVKTGVGWVEVSRNPDPFAYPYRVKEISRKEMWWDWRAREPDLADARFVIRRKWHDADELAGHFPKHKRLIEQAVNVRPAWEDLSGDGSTDLSRSWEIEQTTSIQDEEWRDTTRRRLALYEVWYKTFESVKVLRLPDGRVVEYDKQNPRHAAAVEAGLITPEAARTHRIRVAYYVGPHQLVDQPSPYKHNRFPYVPFFGFREDRSGAPYGLIRAMRSPQEEVNARRTKMMSNLASRRVFVDDDAVEDHEATADEIARNDAYVILNSNRRNANGLKIESEDQINTQHYQLMLESKQNVQEASGLFHEFLGKSAGSGQSGEAIKNLVEQGIQVLGEIMDNYREGRRQCAEILLSLIVEDLSKQDDVDVKVERPTGETKTVMLNERTEEDEHKRNNDVMRLRTHVALDETPSSSTYRQQTLQRLMELTQSLPEGLQGAMVEFVVRASDLPDREEMVKQLRQFAGLPGGEEEPSTPEEAAEMEAQAQAEQQAAQQQQAMEQRAAELELAEREAKVLDLKSKAREREVNALLTEAKAQKLAGADTKLTEAQVFEILKDAARQDREQGASLTERGARLVHEQQEAMAEESLPPPNDPSGPRNGPPAAPG